MRRFDESPLDPDAETTLAVIDATLGGEAVAPEDAELAELTLILAGQRPVASEPFAAALDERVQRRFARPPRRPRRRLRWRSVLAPGAAAGLVAGLAVVVVLSAGGGGSSSGVQMPTVTSSASALSGGVGRALRAESAPSSTSSAAGSSSATSPSPATSPSASGPSSAGGATAPTPPTGGRQVVQSAQLSLSTRPNRVDDVAQQVFDVVSVQDGVVENSNVTATNSSSGYAQFQLSVPSANLQQTMSALSRLRGASVVSRTDSSQDITGQVGGAGRRLADARALRTALLRKLAAATTTSDIDSLKAQIRDAEASIASDQSTLRSLHRKVDNTQIAVTINAASAPGHPAASGSGFTIGKAGHDAGRVLVIAAGVALIALAVLVPLSLLGAIGLWIAGAVRRRRREQVLDLV
ncbi:MAG TPA: DUF4349 domain-containing protein [Solirubrobacteraceae bacterium]|jgi:hypothetical protein